MRQGVVEKFNNLYLGQKCSLVQNYGKWIFYTDTSLYRVSVFELEGELVEVWYNLSERFIARVRMPTYQQLDKHLEKITISYLKIK